MFGVVYVLNSGLKMHFTYFVAIITTFVFVNGNLEDKFHNYDIVREVYIHSLSKREVMDTLHTKHIQLTAFGKNFTLEMKPSQDLFSKNFKVKVIHGNNVEEEMLDFDRSNFLTGHVIGESGSRASLHIDENNLVTGVFTTNEEEYALEPLSSYMVGSNAYHPKSAMIAYRRTDIKTDNDSLPQCGSIHPNITDEPTDYGTSHQDTDGKIGERMKRATGSAKTCMVVAVADYKFTRDVGGGNRYKAANYIVNIMNRVNQIYRSTGFASGTGYGFELGALNIHDGPETSSNKYYYNIAKTDWGTTQLLEAFGRTTLYGDYCLAHLFTSEAMPSSVLGLAYIASSKVGSVGGICSPQRTYNGFPSIFNTGWTSVKNSNGNFVTFTQQSLVTAHGHNWGGEHDPSSGDCAPGSILGDGKYLMYSYSVTGDDPNNDQFSSCSKNYINAVLSNKASTCFQAVSEESLCGNGRLDPGEQCDEGLLSRLSLSTTQDPDACCNGDCTFRTGAQCSPVNYPCCQECQVATNNLVCAGTIEGSCEDTARCDGSSFNCPAAPNKTDFTPCTEGGSCYRGQCLPFCEALFRGFNSCACDTVENSCKRCCRGLDGRCTLYDANLNLPDGRTCIQGYCQNGVCIKVSTDLVGRFWNFIDSISVDFLIQSFKTNVVACVSGFSLVMYTPICIIIWCIDRRRKTNWEKQNSVHIRTDRGLAHDEDKRPVAKPGQSSNSKPSTLNASDLLDTSYRRPSSRNQIQPLSPKPASSEA